MTEPALTDIARQHRGAHRLYRRVYGAATETAASAAAWPRPELVAGAWFYRGYTQMDDEQHVLSGLLSAIPVLEGEESE